MKILIVDDDPISRMLLGEALLNIGHEVDESSSGKDAWMRILGQHYPVVISDWVMPEVDGIELCRRIRTLTDTKYVYFILLTVLEGRGSYLEGMDAGADDFLTKPFDAEQMAMRLRVAERILHLQDQNIRLASLLPICSFCKKIRDDQEYWQQVDEYLAKHSDIQVNHGLCPACMEEKYPAIFQRIAKVDQQV